MHFHPCYPTRGIGPTPVLFTVKAIFMCVFFNIPTVTWSAAPVPAREGHLSRCVEMCLLIDFRDNANICFVLVFEVFASQCHYGVTMGTREGLDH